MNKVLIGCGVLLALGVVSAIGLAVFGTVMFRRVTEGKLVGSFTVERVEVQPEAPSPDDAVSLRVAVMFAGIGPPADGRLELKVTGEKKDAADKHEATVTLTRTAGAGAAGEWHGTATIDVGRLPEGMYTFIVSIQPPAQELLGTVEPPQEVEVVVKPKAGP